MSEENEFPSINNNTNGFDWSGKVYPTPVVGKGFNFCQPNLIKPEELFGKDWFIVRWINSKEHFYFTAGSEIRISMAGAGWGFVKMPHEVYSRKVNANGRIPGIATTRKALNEQHDEPQAQYLNPFNIKAGDFKGDGTTYQIRNTPFGVPLSYRFGSANDTIAWEIHTGFFNTMSDVGADFLGLVILMKIADTSKLKIFPNGWGAGDLIGTEKPFYERVWDKITGN